MFCGRSDERNHSVRAEVRTYNRCRPTRNVRRSASVHRPAFSLDGSLDFFRGFALLAPTESLYSYSIVLSLPSYSETISFQRNSIRSDINIHATITITTDHTSLDTTIGCKEDIRTISRLMLLDPTYRRGSVLIPTCDASRSEKDSPTCRRSLNEKASYETSDVRHVSYENIMKSI